MRPFFEFLRDRFGEEPLVGVEIGVHKGDNASEILDGLCIYKLFLVDPWMPFDNKGNASFKMREKWLTKEYHDFCFEFVRERFLGRDDIEIVRATSLEASRLNLYPEGFDFVYIDAVHDYENVLRDCRCWYPLLSSRGYIGGHDYWNKEFPGVKKAVDEFAREVHKDVIAKGVDWWLK